MTIQLDEIRIERSDPRPNSLKYSNIIQHDSKASRHYMTTRQTSGRALKRSTWNEIAPNHMQRIHLLATFSQLDCSFILTTYIACSLNASIPFFANLPP